MFSKVALALGASAVLAAPTDCSSQASPATDPLLQTCYLVEENIAAYDICWTPPGVPVPCTLQNHITYDLLALYRLGANASRLQQVYDYHLQTELLNPAVPSTGAITDANWLQNVGANAMDPTGNYSDYVAFYKSKISSFEDLQPALDTYLPALVDGVFGHLFHGLLYLGWGAADVLNGKSGDLNIVAQGLAWMSTNSQPPLPLATAPKQTKPLDALYEMYKDLSLPHYQGDPQALYFVFFGDLVANHSQTLQHYDLLVADDISLEDATTMIREVQYATMVLFSSGANFSSFMTHHFVSSSFAVEQLLPHLSPKLRAQLIRRHWQSVVVNYAIDSRPSIYHAVVPASVPSWDELIARAFLQGDVHVHKFVYLARDAAAFPKIFSDENLLKHSADMCLKVFEAGGTWHF